MITCPQCNASNIIGSMFCDNCGASLPQDAPPSLSTSAAVPPAPLPTPEVVVTTPAPTPAPAVPPVAIPTAAASDKIQCAICGAQNSTASSFCENCGSPLNRVAPPPEPIAAQPTPTPSAPAPSIPPAEAVAPLVPIVAPPPAITPPVVVPPPAAAPVLPKMIVPSSQPPPTGHPRLQVVSNGAYFDLRDYTEILVGRVDPTSDIFPQVDLTAHGGDEGGVSRRHLQITLEGHQYFAEDLKSANGSWIGTQRLAPHTRTPLNHGDQVRLGKVLLSFYAQ